MNGSRVLVTGGAGFIGSNLSNALAADNKVIAVDNCYLGTPDNLDSEVEFVERSVLDDDLPADVDVVFHLADLSSYEMHETAPRRGVRVAVEGFTNVVEQARRCGCETVVYASSSSVYGSGTSATSGGETVTVNTGYEASKVSRERYGEYFSNHHGLTVCGLRLFSVYEGYGGAENHKDEYANVVTQFADAIANGQSPRVYGDGTQTRDFVHVDDVVRAFERAAEYGLDGVYDVGTGEQFSFNQVIDLLNEALDTAVEPTYVTNPIPEHVYVHDTCADASRFGAAVGWQPRISLEEGIQRVCSTYVE